MQKIILSADSTCDLGEELKQRFDVHFYPYHIIYRGKDYLDNIDIHPDDFYAGYYEDGSLPRTTAINTQEYRDYFLGFVKQGFEVIHFNLGGAISSSHENAAAAAADLDGVYAIDSFNLSTGIAQLVIRAGRLIEQGKDAADIVAEIEAMRSRVHSSFVLDTLDFMAAGGRCPAVLSYVGKVLKFKVEILVDNADGSMHMGKIYRGNMKKVLQKYVRDTVASYKDILRDDIFITHSGIDSDCIEVVQNELAELLPDMERVHVTVASCTISSHCGPGTLGILFVTAS